MGVNLFLFYQGSREIRFRFWIRGVVFLMQGFLKIDARWVEGEHKPRTQSGVASQFPHTFTPTNLAPPPHRTNAPTSYRNAAHTLTITSTHYTQRHNTLSTFTLDHAQTRPSSCHPPRHKAPHGHDDDRTGQSNIRGVQSHINLNHTRQRRSWGTRV